MVDRATRVLLAGGTGLVGGLLSARLACRADMTVDSLVRMPARAGERPIDFEALVADPAGVAGSGAADVGVSCLGTTMHTAGSRAAFRRVDLDYVLAVARAARARGAPRFVLVSAVGAGGGGFYLRVKSDTETAVRALGFERLDIVRPGLLLGPRPERRTAERVAQALAPLLTPVLRGRLARYAAIDAAMVAAAIERLILATAPGMRVHHAPELQALAAASAG